MFFFRIFRISQTFTPFETKINIRKAPIIKPRTIPGTQSLHDVVFKDLVEPAMICSTNLCLYNLFIVILAHDFNATMKGVPSLFASKIRGMPKFTFTGIIGCILLLYQGNLK